MRRLLTIAVAAGTAALAAPQADTACCYFSAMGQDVDQPAQKAFIDWDPDEEVESFIVQPAFKGNATDFGMVVPTPAQPKLAEAPRDFFTALAVYTILKPTNWKKFQQVKYKGARSGGGAPTLSAPGGRVRRESVKVLEAGVVGSLDYKVIEATDATGLYDWLTANDYKYSGDTETLDHYIRRRWFFTVMKIDPKQMKRAADGSYTGSVTPTRFTFVSKQLIYPLRITKISVKRQTEALFYVQAPQKMDLPEAFTYQLSFQVMWGQSYSRAIWENCSQAERDWWDHIAPLREKTLEEFMSWKRRRCGPALSRLDWARRITADDIDLCTNVAAYDRKAPAKDVKKLRLLKGILRKGRFVTKFRHTFLRDEMNADLVFREAKFAGRRDTVEHVEILPTSPP